MPARRGWNAASPSTARNLCEQADRHSCLYLKWMLERVEAGWVDVPNPMFRHVSDPLKRLTHVSVLPNDVLAIAWWSKNYAVYECFYGSFRRFPTQFFHFTINPRRGDLSWIEPDVPRIEEAIRQVRFLASQPGGAEMVAWRYDPIMFWSEGSQDRSSWDPRFFEEMCRCLSELGITHYVTSVADRYGKFEQRVRRNFPHVTLRDPAAEEIVALGDDMTQIASVYGMQLMSCTEPTLRSVSSKEG